MTIAKFNETFDIRQSISVSDFEIKIESESLRRFIESKTGFLFDKILIAVGDLDEISICCVYTAFDEQHYIYFPAELTDDEFEAATN